MGNIFLYENPFVVENNSSNINKYVLECMMDSEKEEEKEIYQIILKFAVRENLIVKTNGNYLINTGFDVGSWKWAITTTNFRSFVNNSQYIKFINALELGVDYPIDKIIDLHFRLGSLFDRRLLNTVTNRIFNSIMIVPYKLKDGDEVINWSTIHSSTPFMWVCILLQLILNTEIGKTIGD